MYSKCKVRWKKKSFCDNLTRCRCSKRRSLSKTRRSLWNCRRTKRTCKWISMTSRISTPSSMASPKSMANSFWRTKKVARTPSTISICSKKASRLSRNSFRRSLIVSSSRWIGLRQRPRAPSSWGSRIGLKFRSLRRQSLEWSNRRSSRRRLRSWTLICSAN